jgi:Skp family chaperone for outer membrane proteins
MAKILLIVAIVASLLTAGLGFLNRGTLISTREELATTTSTLDSTKKELGDTQEKLTASQTELAALTKAKDAMQSLSSSSRSDLEMAKSQLASATEKATDLESQLAEAKTDLQAKDTRIAELEAASTGAVAVQDTGNTAELETRIAEQETLITKLQGDLTGARSQLEELRERERNRAAQVMRSGLEGKVLAVNQAWNFVVLNLGDRNGVVSNAEMLVKRGPQLIGKIRITSVEPSTSIADIVANSTPRGLVIQPGDSVIYVGSAE